MNISIIIIFVIGLILGSFLNVLIYRLFKNLSIWPRSFCLNCKRKIKFKDLIPLLSFVILKAKCRFCKEKISWQYFIIELVTGILFVLFYLKYLTINTFLVRDLFLVFVLLFILVFDLKYYLILEKIIWPLVLVIFIANLFLGYVWWDLLLGALIGGSFFLLQYVLTKAKGIGFGDIVLGVLMGIIFGWQMVILTIIIAYLIGGLVALILLISKKKKLGDILPMGSFMAAAAIIVLLCGENIFNFLI